MPQTFDISANQPLCRHVAGPLRKDAQLWAAHHRRAIIVDAPHHTLSSAGDCLRLMTRIVLAVSQHSSSEDQAADAAANTVTREPVDAAKQVPLKHAALSSGCVTAGIHRDCSAEAGAASFGALMGAQGAAEALCHCAHGVGSQLVWHWLPHDWPLRCSSARAVLLRRGSRFVAAILLKQIQDGSGSDWLPLVCVPMQTAARAIVQASKEMAKSAEMNKCARGGSAPHTVRLMGCHLRSERASMQLGEAAEAMYGACWPWLRQVGGGAPDASSESDSESDSDDHYEARLWRLR